MTSDSNFDYAVNRTLRAEGVWSQHPLDRGGKTKFGITEVELLRWNPDARIEDLSIEEATRIYHVAYWLGAGCDLLLDRYIAAEVFDSCVNCGVGTGVKFLQRACNMLRRINERALTVDGVLGPRTAALANHLVELGFRSALYHALNGEQYSYYAALVNMNPTYLTFTRGWAQKRLMPNIDLLREEGLLGSHT